jgi:uncharacterized protein involved in type VI secretion and phage assembly
MIAASCKSGIDRNDGFARDGVARYYGKYRGTVINNVDPNGLGRIQVLVPAVSPLPLANWALMCTPVGGPQHGMFAVPPPTAGVWVEFESGNPDYPIWAGCFYGAGFESPKQAPQPNPVMQSITLQTPTQNCLVINDLPGPGGAIQIRIHGQTMVTVAEGYIELNNKLGATIKMVGPQIEIDALKVTINKGALEIM